MKTKTHTIEKCNSKSILWLIMFAILLLPSLKSNAQNVGNIDGYVISSIDSLPVPSAHVIITAGAKKYGVVTNEKGYFIAKAIEPGTYTVTVSYSGFESWNKNNVPVNTNLSTQMGKIYLGSVMLDQTEIFGSNYESPIINIDGGVIKTMERKELENLPDATNIPAVLASMSSEFYVGEDATEMHFRGSREDMTAFYVDGMRVSSTDGIPSSALRSITVYGGGIPARYGDLTGGVVVIETMSYSEWVEERNKKEAYWRYVYEMEEKAATSPADVEKTSDSSDE